MLYTILFLLLILIVLIAIVVYVNYITSTRRKVVKILRAHKVPYKQWDANGSTRTLDKLVKSFETGEITFESNGGTLILHIHVAVATIRCKRCKHGVHWMELREYRSINSHDEPTLRKFSGSVGGKIRTRDESAITALRRELAEELGHSQPEFKYPESYSLTESHDETLGPQESDAHPGTQDVYHRKHFDCVIGLDMFCNRYEEIRDDGKRVQFGWIPIPDL